MRRAFTSGRDGAKLEWLSLRACIGRARSDVATQAIYSLLVRANIIERKHRYRSATIHPKVDTPMRVNRIAAVSCGGSGHSIAESHTPSRRGIHENWSLWLC